MKKDHKCKIVFCRQALLTRLKKQVSSVLNAADATAFFDYVKAAMYAPTASEFATLFANFEQPKFAAAKHVVRQEMLSLYRSCWGDYFVKNSFMMGLTSLDCVEGVCSIVC